MKAPIRTQRQEIAPAYKTPPLGGVTTSPLHKIIENRYHGYARMVVEDRAIPDFRDGLIPVYRRILWAMYRLHNHHNTKYLKKARIVGDTMGKYHPHGDISIVNAMTTMAKGKTAIPLIDGQGNWGSYKSKAGAMRYIEARLSEFSDKVLLDPYYMRAVTKIPSYDGSDEEPLYLPALLPNLLLFGIDGGIAVGTTAVLPPFHPQGIKDLLTLAFRNKSISPELCHHHLRMNYRWGGQIVSSNDEMINFYRTGEQTIYFSCNYTVDGKIITITGIPPRWNYDNNIESLQDHPDVASVKQLSKHGIEVIITMKNTDLKSFQRVEKKLQTYVAARSNVTLRYVSRGGIVSESGAEFHASNIPSILQKWARWRIALERRAIGIHLTELRKEIHNLELLVKATNHLDDIVKILKIRNTKVSIEQQLSSILHISQEDAAYIFDQRTRRLAHISILDITAKIKELQQEQAAMHGHLNDPVPLVIAKTNKLFDLVLKANK
jgi:DNA gyrase/topoisomerase IV subunit A